MFLGIQIDTEAEVIRFRQIESDTERDSAMERETINDKKELLQLFGKLQHACCVVRPGRYFLRRMIGYGCKRTPTQDQTQQGFLIGSAMVGNIYRITERHESECGV